MDPGIRYQNPGQAYDYRASEIGAQYCLVKRSNFWLFQQKKQDANRKPPKLTDHRTGSDTKKNYFPTGSKQLANHPERC